ncbi:hypothetical protein BDP55DRAFT_362566 [Colletotrichum godetiae]|uniref:Secreted protein n=1 Tax=Colletotrichum godetiae TaxID=1209918 RepID=A0AAJ0AA27_9PEZI|nr:uncharacterized protein BDP55DRAFT_362566 [Colletotrichum godetiae]KAK1659319.1 hypothetical protein BDP55DRAFT_362566 [Colletotrichum godetiae]
MPCSLFPSLVIRTFLLLSHLESGPRICTFTTSLHVHTGTHILPSNPSKSLSFLHLAFVHHPKTPPPIDSSWSPT